MLPVSDVIPSRTVPWTTLGVIAVNLAAFAAAWSAGAEHAAVVRRLWLVPSDASWIAASTALFLHENAPHLALNVLLLWVFGDNVEDQLGHVRFLLLYLAAGYAGWAAVLWAAPGSTAALAGASGAIAGVLAAYFVMFPRSRVLLLVPTRSGVDAVELPAALVVAAWFALQTLGGLGRVGGPLGGSGVALWPLVGGAVTGGVSVRFMRRPERRRVEWWER